MRTRYAKLLVLVGLCCVAPLLNGCGGSGSAASSVVNANKQLGGSWRLQSFSPAVALDLPLHAVLTAEVGALVVTFNQGQYTAVGPGVSLSGRYEVSSASGAQVALVLYDQQNVAHHFTAQFGGSLLNFQTEDKPWAGFGALERV